MVTRLTFVDYCEPDWGPVELYSDPQAYRAFWTCVLQFATADQRSAVHYQLNAGEDCLATEIEGVRYSFVPPPEEYRRELLQAARQLAFGGRLRRLFSLKRRTAQLGCLALETPQGDVVWHVHEVPSGLQFVRAGSVLLTSAPS